MSNINTQGFGIQLAPAGFPLEANKIFVDYAAALEFVKTKPAAYVGSIITVSAPSTIDGVTYPKGAYIVDAVGENAVLTQVGKETNFSIVKATEADEGYSATYQLVKIQDGPSGTIASVPVAGAAKINIPKDMVVSSGEVVVFTADNLIPGVSEAGTYIKLNLANSQAPIYVNVNDLVDAGAIAELEERVIKAERTLEDTIVNIDAIKNVINLSDAYVLTPKVMVTDELPTTIKISEDDNAFHGAHAYITDSSDLIAYIDDATAIVPFQYGKNDFKLHVESQDYALPGGAIKFEKPFSIVVLPSIKIGVSTVEGLLPNTNISTNYYPYDECCHVHEVGFDESLTEPKNGWLCVILPTGGGYDSLLSVSVGGHNVPIEETNKEVVDGLTCTIYHSVDRLIGGTFDNIVLTVRDSL